MKDLIQAVLDDPTAVLHGRSAAGDQLVAIGPPALPLIQEILDGTWSSKEHPVDVIEAFMLLAQRIHGRA
jgi:hypothetical protein